MRGLPNAVVENRVNGYAHVMWAMREPITRTEHACRNPLAYAAALAADCCAQSAETSATAVLMTKYQFQNDSDASGLPDHLYTHTEH